MKLIITIDTEEDNWADYSPTGYTLENIQRIPVLQELFDEFRVKPTYLITYPAAVDEKAIRILKGIVKRGQCEIGTHCHPWNTPPFEEKTSSKNSMLCNLPVDLQYKKIRHLHHTILKNYDIEPVSFRNGRWSYNKDIAENLYKLGYKVDTSILPYTDWRNYHGTDFSNISPHPFKFSMDDIFRESSNGDMAEIPATVGFLQQNFILSNSIWKMLNKKPFKRVKLVGLFSRLNLLNKVWLSPELSDGKTMIKLAQSMERNNYTIINMFFHSSSLKAGLTPYIKTKDDERKFLQTIREFLTFARDNGIDSIKLRDSPGLL